MSTEYGRIGTEVAQSFRNNNGIFTPKDIYELDAENKWTNFGQLELIETQNASSDSALDFATLGDYNVHFLTCNDITPATDNVTLQIQLFENGTLESGAVYQYALQRGQANSTFSEDVNTTSTVLGGSSAIGNATNETGNAYFYFYNLKDSTKYSFQTQMSIVINNAGTFAMNFGSAVLPQASYVDKIRVKVSSGNFSGTASLYGIRSF